MRFTLRTHQTFAEAAKSSALGGFTLGCILAVHTEFWLWPLLLPPSGLAVAQATTRGPMHTSATEVFNATVLAAVATLLIALILDWRSPAALLAVAAAAWPAWYALIRLQTRRTRRRMAGRQS